MADVRFETLAHGALPRDVREAWMRSADVRGASPFATPGFFDAWCGAFAPERTGFVVIGHRGGRIELVVPMWHARDAEGDWRSLGELRADYSEPFAVPAAADELGFAFWRWLERDAPCRTAKLSRMPAETWLARAVPPSARRRRGRLEAAACNAVRARGVRYLRATDQAEHPYADRAKLEEMAARLSSKATKRNLRYLEREGAVSYRVVRGAEIVPLLPALFEMHVSNFVGSGRASQFESAAERAFYRELALHPELAASTCLDVLAVGDRHAALHFGFDHAGVMYWYKPAYALDLAKVSPGRSLLAFVYDRAFVQGNDRFDLLKGAEAYKDEWANHVRQTSTVTLVRRRLRDVVWSMVRKAPA